MKNSDNLTSILPLIYWLIRNSSDCQYLKKYGDEFSYYYLF